MPPAPSASARSRTADGGARPWRGGFEPYLRAVRRHPFIVILIAVASVAGAGAEMGLRPHRYQAVAQVLVTPVPFAQANYAGLPIIRDEPSDPARATQTAATMLDSPNAAAATARPIGDRWTEGSVQADITVQPIGGKGTNVLAVQAEAANALLAARIVNTYVSATLDQRRRALRGEASSSRPRSSRPRHGFPFRACLTRFSPSAGGLIQASHCFAGPAPPAAPAGPAAWRTLSMVLFAGLVLGVAVALIADGAMRRLRSVLEPPSRTAPRSTGGPKSLPVTLPIPTEHRSDEQHGPWPPRIAAANSGNLRGDSSRRRVGRAVRRPADVGGHRDRWGCVRDGRDDHSSGRNGDLDRGGVRGPRTGYLRYGAAHWRRLASEVSPRDPGSSARLFRVSECWSVHSRCCSRGCACRGYGLEIPR